MKRGVIFERKLSSKHQNELNYIVIEIEIINFNFGEIGMQFKWRMCGSEMVSTAILNAPSKSKKQRAHRYAYSAA
jgi:hypothetical protein